MEYIGNLENEDWQRTHRHKFGGNRVIFSITKSNKQQLCVNYISLKLEKKKIKFLNSYIHLSVLPRKMFCRFKKIKQTLMKRN